MATSTFDLGIDLADSGVKTAAAYESSTSWTLGCSISAEDIDASMQEVYAGDIELNGDIIIHAVAVDVDAEVIDVIYLEISVCTCGFSSGEGSGTGGGGGGCSCIIDTEMSDFSENAVQNKVIKAYADLHSRYEQIEDIIPPDEVEDYATKDWVRKGFLTPSSLKTINGESLVGEGDIIIEAGTDIEVDTVMSDTSVNAVQNKTIKEYVDLHPRYEAIDEIVPPEEVEDYATKEWVRAQGYLTEITSYIHYQDEASNRWVINHNMNRFPSVTVVDSGGNIVFGDTAYNDANQVTITFTAPFGGKAFLN